MSDGVRDGRERDGQVLIKMNYQLQEHDAYPGVVVLASTHHLSFDFFCFGFGSTRRIIRSTVLEYRFENAGGP